MLCCAVLTQVTVLFCDLTNFTSLCGQLHPAQVMLFLDALYSCLDELCEEHKVYKVETIGDCFMVCGGLFSEGGGRREGAVPPSTEAAATQPTRT